MIYCHSSRRREVTPGLDAGDVLVFDEIVIQLGGFNEVPFV